MILAIAFFVALAQKIRGIKAVVEAMVTSQHNLITEHRERPKTTTRNIQQSQRNRSQHIPVRHLNTAILFGCVGLSFPVLHVMHSDCVAEGVIDGHRLELRTVVGLGMDEARMSPEQTHSLIALSFIALSHCTLSLTRSQSTVHSLSYTFATSNMTACTYVNEVRCLVRMGLDFGSHVVQGCGNVGRNEVGSAGEVHGAPPKSGVTVQENQQRSQAAVAGLVEVVDLDGAMSNEHA